MVLNAFNAVLIGDSFPVASLRADEFSFRHRPFKEEMRIGPTFQATCQNVAIFALPDRFQVSVGVADDLKVQTAGVDEVLDVFADYVGKRSLKAFGVNAQAQLPREVDIYSTLFAHENIGRWLQSTAPPQGNAVLIFKRGEEDRATATIGKSDANDVVLEFNFHFELVEPGRFTIARQNLLPSLETAEQMANEFLRTFETVS